MWLHRTYPIARRCRHIAVLGTLLWTSTAVASDAAQTAERVLRPEAAPVVQAAFGRADGVRLHGARLQRDHVEATVCATNGAQACSAVTLGDPSQPCTGTLAGPWCVSWQGAAPTYAASLLAALAADPPDRIWSRPADAPAPPRSPWLYCLGWLGIAVALGSLLAIAVRFPRRQRLQTAKSAWLVALTPAAALAVVGFATIQVGIWDLLSLGGLAGLVGLLWGHRVGQNRLGWAVASLTGGVGVVLLEGLCHFLPMPPAFPPPESASIWIPDLEAHEEAGRLHPQSGQAVCDLLFPSAGRPDPLPLLLQAPVGTTKRVLHLGDSLAFGSGVTVAQRFTTLLQQAMPGVAHLNAATPATSIDAQWLVARRALALGHYDLVVLHAFVGNDLVEVDRPFPCCEDGPLLAWPPGQPPQARCTQANWRPARGMSAWYLARSAPPYPLRVLTATSLLARHLCGLAISVTQRLGDGARLPDAQAGERYQQVARQLAHDCRQAGIRLVVVLLPVRTAVARGPQGNAAVIQRLASDPGVPVLDAWSEFTAALPSHPEDSLFLQDPPGDPHLSALGHRLLAQWLAGPLQAQLGQPTPPANGQP